MRIKEISFTTKIIEYKVVERFGDEEYKKIKSDQSNIRFFQGLTFSWRAVIDNLASIEG